MDLARFPLILQSSHTLGRVGQHLVQQVHCCPRYSPSPTCMGLTLPQKYTHLTRPLRDTAQCTREAAVPVEASALELSRDHPCGQAPALVAIRVHRPLTKILPHLNSHLRLDYDVARGSTARGAMFQARAQRASGVRDGRKQAPDVSAPPPSVLPHWELACSFLPPLSLRRAPSMPLPRSHTSV